MVPRRKSIGRGLAAVFVASLLGVAAPASATGLGETVAFGAYANGLPYDDAEFLSLEKRVGSKFDIASGFVDWEYVLGEERDVKLAAGGRTLLYSWEPHCTPKGRCISFRDIAKGRVDEYLGRVAESMKRFPSDIYVRPWAEMNAHWSPYEPGTKRPRAGSLADFKAAWRHLYDFFRTRGVKNLKFVFNPEVAGDPRNVPIKDLWPGKDPKDGHGYVDVLGMDAYNWGDSKQEGGEAWLEFDQLFAEGYRALTALDPDAPVWVCEFGSKEPQKNDGTPNSPAPPDEAHDKGAWIQHMLASTAFPRMQALAYYSSYLPNHDNQRDFRLESSAASLNAVRAYLRARRAHHQVGKPVPEHGTPTPRP